MAELQRYQGGNTPFQQVDPTAAKASAQMFGTLSQRLEEWGDYAYKRAQVEVAEQGQQNAIKDMLSGDPLKVEKGHTFYAKAYNDISKAAYNVQVESDLKKKAEEFAIQFQTDPNGFNNAFDAYAKEALKLQQEPEFQAILKQKAMTLQGTYGANVAKEAFKLNRENEKKALDAYLTDERNTYSAFISNGKVQEATDSLAKITQILDLQVQAGVMHKAMVPLEIKKVQEGAQETMLMMRLDESLERGETDYVQNFTSSPEYKAMPMDRRTALTKKMYEHVDGKFKAQTEAFDANATLVEKVSKKKALDISTEIMLDNPPSDETLNDMLRNHTLRPEEYKQIVELKADLQNGPLVDNEDVVMEYELSIEYLNPAVVSRDKRVTTKTRKDIVRRAISHQRRVASDKQLADAMRGFKQTMGGDPWKVADDYVVANVPLDDPTELKRLRLNLKNQLRKEVEAGQISVFDVPTVMETKVNEYLVKNKDKTDSRRYDRELKKYQDEIKTYNKSRASTFGKIKDKIGVEPPAPPKAPEKPANYIPKGK
jgi:hypothetical protein